jgi:hypothetical protein
MITFICYIFRQFNSGWIRIPNLMIKIQVFYHCATTTVGHNGNTFNDFTFDTFSSANTAMLPLQLFNLQIFIYCYK